MSLMYFSIVKSLFLEKAAGVSYQKEFSSAGKLMEMSLDLREICIYLNRS